MICSANQWTGFNMIGTCVMKKLSCSSPSILQKPLLIGCKAEFAFFSIWVFFHEQDVTVQQGKEEDFHNFNPLHWHLDISPVIAAENSPLCEQYKAWFSGWTPDFCFVFYNSKPRPDIKVVELSKNDIVSLSVQDLKQLTRTWKHIQFSWKVESVDPEPENL